MTAPTLDPTEVLLGLNNGPGIFIAPASTPPPADTVAPWASPWDALGYISGDGVTLSSNTSSDNLTPWQSTSPIRTMITGKELSLQFVMWQTDPVSMGLWFDVAPPAAVAGALAFDVRSDGGGLLYAVGIDVKDGSSVFRVVFPRSQLSNNGDVSIARGSAVGWDVTLTALDDNGVLAHIIGKLTPAVVATGATAGIPGVFTPSGAVAPANVAAMTGLTASPATAWTTGQYVQTATAGTPGQAHWSGSAWVAGAA